MSLCLPILRTDLAIDDPTTLWKLLHTCLGCSIVSTPETLSADSLSLSTMPSYLLRRASDCKQQVPGLMLLGSSRESPLLKAFTVFY